MAEFDYEVVNGRKIRVRPQEVVSEIDENGYFVRQPNHFTEGFGEGKNPVEKGRYHLVWAKLCHWSNRASIVRELLGLEDAISVNMVDHAKHEKNLGWEFVYDKDHIDPVLGIQFLSEAYYKADDDYTGRTTVPALIDTKTGMLLVSHEMSFVRNVATRVIFLDGGKILEDGTPREVFGNPKNERVKEFFTKINRMEEPDYSI